jgi:hypothetical protein
MILADNTAAVAKDGKSYNLPAFTEIQNVKPASDRGFWFDAAIYSFAQKSWHRVWALNINILRD